MLNTKSVNVKIVQYLCMPSPTHGANNTNYICLFSQIKNACILTFLYSI